MTITSNRIGGNLEATQIANEKLALFQREGIDPCDLAGIARILICSAVHRICCRLNYHPINILFHRPLSWLSNSPDWTPRSLDLLSKNTTQSEWIEISSKLDQLYEISLRENYKSSGSVFTPTWLTDYCSQDLLKNNGETIFDPTCGGGAFLISAARRAISLSPVDKIELIPRTIYGCDIDPQAVDVTRAMLAQIYLDAGISPQVIADSLESNILVKNSLLDPEILGLAPDEHPDLLCLTRDLPEIASRGGFDIILGNPPYGINRSGVFNEAERRWIRDLFPELNRGKPNKYQHFTLRALRLLKEHGKMAFVIPNSIMGIDDARELRSLLINERAIDRIEILDRATFSNHGVETILLQLSRKPPSSIEKSAHFTIRDITSKISHLISYTDITEADRFRLPRLSRDSLPVELRRITSTNLHLGDPNSPFIPMIALQAYATGKGSPPQTEQMVRDKVFHSENCLDKSYIPYLSPNKVGRYRLEPADRYIRYGPWLAEHQPLDRYTRPRLLIREITGKSPFLIQAAYCEEQAIYNRSILHILGKGCSKTMLLALLGLLNSEPISLWLSVHGRKASRGLFPKVLCSDLRELPIPDNLEVRHLPLANLVDARLNSPNMEQSAKLESQINILVLEMYG